MPAPNDASREASVAEPTRDVGFGPLDIGAQRRGLSGELAAKLGNLAFSPAPFTMPHGKGGVEAAMGHFAS